ncbi:MAG: hypothetical protein HQL72_12920 [Magnetococcales bacterium]|nr:hypothetical protein [Magnetococcales bacterium]
MSVCILIDGLLMEGDTAPGIFTPDVVRMAAVGQSGVLDLGTDSAHPERGDIYRNLLLGQDEAETPAALPLGYLSALGFGLDPDPKKSWASLGLMHLFQKANKLLFLPPDRVGLSVEEKRGLIEALKSEFAQQGWLVHYSEAWGKAVISSEQTLSARATAPSLLEGASFHDFLPQGEDASQLLSLVTTGQMLLAREPLNRQREAEQRLPLNTPWVWGVGTGEEYRCPPLSVGRTGCAWSGDPVVAGLARLSGLHPNHLDEQQGIQLAWVEEVAEVALRERAVVHFQAPARLARLGLLPERQALLEEINHRFLSPLSERLAQGGGQLTLGTPARLNKVGQPIIAPVPWLSIRGEAMRGKQRFWHRKKLGEGEPITVTQFCEEWTL